MSQAVKVGIFATLVLLLAAWFVLKIEDFNPFDPAGETLDAEFPSVAGLDDGAAVRIAGVRVGRVDGIELAGRAARVHLVLDDDLPLTEGTYARIASLGLLGDKFVDIVPGPPGAPPLPEDVVLPGETGLSFDDAMAKLNDVADSISGLAGSFGGALSGEGEPTPLSRLIGNLESTSAEVRVLVEANREQLDSTIRNFEQVSATLARELPGLVARMEGLIAEVGGLVGEVGGVVGENRADVRRSTENFAELTEEMRTAAANLSAISGRLERGEGTLGKLLTSEEAHAELVDTMDSIQAGVGDLTDTLGRAKRLRLDLDLQGFALADRDDSHGTFGLTVLPGEDSNKLYRVALSSTPAGDTREKTQVITVTNPDGSVETTTVETFTREEDTVLSAQVGVRLRTDTRLWAGLIEDSFGVQAEQPFWDRRLWVDLEAFDFDRPGDRDPHLRLTGRYHLDDNVFVLGGYDDPLESDLDSFFLGGGVRWTDDDLKYLLGAIPLGGF